jgi:uncharacterized protein (DUF983 family)
VVGPLLAARALPLRCAACTSTKFYTGYVKLRGAGRSCCLALQQSALFAPQLL